MTQMQTLQDISITQTREIYTLKEIVRKLEYRIKILEQKNIKGDF